MVVHARDVVIHGFHIRVMFVDISVNFFEVSFFKIRRGRIGRTDRRENSKCFIGVCRYGSCVHVGRYCE